MCEALEREGLLQDIFWMITRGLLVKMFRSQITKIYCYPLTVIVRFMVKDLTTPFHNVNLCKKKQCMVYHPRDIYDLFNLSKLFVFVSS